MINKRNGKTSLISAKIIMMLMIPALAVDSLTGFLELYGLNFISPVQIYRVLMLGMMVVWISLFYKKGRVILLTLMTMVIFFIAMHMMNFFGLSELLHDLRFQLSLVTHFIFFLFMVGYIEILKFRQDALRQLLKYVKIIVLVSFFIVVINVFLGIFGIGASVLASYASSDVLGGGGKGFFIAGNDVSVVFLILCGIMLAFTWERAVLSKYMWLSIFQLAVSILLMSKTAILGSFILIVSIPMLMSPAIISCRLRFRPIKPLMIAGVVGISAGIWLYSINSAIVQRSMYLYDKYNLATAVFTGRNNFVDAALNIFLYKYSFFEYLFGRGWDAFLVSMLQGELGRWKSVEIDYADIVMMNGFFGLAMVLVIWGVYIRSSLGQFKRLSVARVVLFIDILLLILAGTTGHVLYSAMAGMFIALLNILPILDGRIKSLTKRNGI